MLLETLTCLMADLREVSKSSWKHAKGRREKVCVSVLRSHFNRYNLNCSSFSLSFPTFLSLFQFLPNPLHHATPLPPLAFLLALTLVSAHIPQMTALQAEAYRQA